MAEFVGCGVPNKRTSNIAEYILVGKVVGQWSALSLGHIYSLLYSRAHIYGVHTCMSHGPNILS